MRRATLREWRGRRAQVGREESIVSVAGTVTPPAVAETSYTPSARAPIGADREVRAQVTLWDVDRGALGAR